MFDDQTPAEAPDVDTPDVAEDHAPEGAEPQTDTQSGDVDYAKRYNDLRPEFDRTKQELAQMRSLFEALQSEDPEQRAEAAERLGLDFVDETDDEGEFDADDDVEVDPLEQLRREVEELKSERAKQQEQQWFAQVDEFVDDQIKTLAQEKGVEIDKDYEQDIVTLAMALPAGENDMPDIKGAFERLESRWDQRQKAWAQSKQAPHVSPVGEAASQQPDLSNERVRQEYMAERLAQRGWE